MSKEVSAENNDKETLAALFKGRKSKWLPLYRRLLARFTTFPGVEFFPLKSQIGIGHPRDRRATMGQIRITDKGIEVGLGLARSFGRTERLKSSLRSPKWITHRVLLTQASDIDEEFLAWIKAARLQARTSRPRSA